MGKEVVSPLRRRMIEDMNARKLGKHSQRSHIHSCMRFAAFLKRSPETATPDDIRRFQLHLIESGLSICNRNRVMTGVKFLVRVTLRRLDLAAEIRPQILSSVGVEILEAQQMMYAYGIPGAAKIKLGEEYVLEMPLIGARGVLYIEPKPAFVELPAKESYCKFLTLFIWSQKQLIGMALN
jgi:hypothetical protein